MPLMSQPSVISTSSRHRDRDDLDGRNVIAEFTIANLRDILVAKADLPEGMVVDDPDTALIDFGVDSVGLVAVQLELEDRYGVTIRSEDAPRLATVGSAVQYVNELIGRR